MVTIIIYLFLLFMHKYITLYINFRVFINYLLYEYEYEQQAQAQAHRQQEPKEKLETFATLYIRYISYYIYIILVYCSRNS